MSGVADAWLATADDSNGALGAAADDLIDGQLERIGAFVHDVRQRGGPADRMDLTLASLDAVWAWILEAVAPADPAPRGSGTTSDLPWWAERHPSWVAELGAPTARLLTGLTDYVFACAIAASPEAGWSTEATEDGEPAFRFADGSLAPWYLPMVAALVGLRGVGESRAPSPRKVLEAWLAGADGRHAELAALRARSPAFVVEGVGDDRFTHRVTFDPPEAADGRVARLVQDLADVPLVEAALPAAPGRLLVRAPNTATPALAAAVRDAWSRVVAPSHVSGT